ncbi:hypothetical protein QYF61_009870 [Mycteria americana]|uniref:Uncharacterized protein n=1 Tax=Mycteria americana TaxID=33587 RepID=A0AAN7N4K7_MYCAM|nr:hypothetical protein QYF61_009870 [Mycteria americana]
MSRGEVGQREREGGKKVRHLEKSVSMRYQKVDEKPHFHLDGGTACHRHTGGSQVSGHLDDEYTGASLIWRKVGKAGTVPHREEKSQGRSHQCEGCEERRARLFSMVSSDRTRGIWHKLKQRRLSFERTRNPFSE